MDEKQNLSLLNGIPPLLLRWYDQNARDLPWRRFSDPYKIWVSEVMLQQTRVDTVIPYYERFLRTYPDIRTLAQADSEQLLKHWEGLGYYSRARNLQKAAVLLTQEHNGRLPRAFAQLKALPGIGDYTAGAIASIAFGLPTPVVDGNVLRVVSRVLERYDDIAQPAVKKRYHALLAQIIPPQRPGDFNQAMMELGAVVCLPGSLARCDVCPLNGLCAAYQNDAVQGLPVKTKRPPRKQEQLSVLVLAAPNNRYALRKRGPTGLLADMWEFIHFPGHLCEEEVYALLAELGLHPLCCTPLGQTTHIFTHITWEMVGYRVCVLSASDMEGVEWVGSDELAHAYAIPSAFSHYLRSGVVKHEP
ncbi:MAG: A/G-specific adenine glycosylase [Christensenellales bacterium]|jgi:A/G-specific adenine glycosylase